DSPAADHREVESMQWLGVFQRDVVRDVDDVADRPHSGRIQPASEPEGRRSYGDAGDRGAYVSPAELRRLDRDAGEVGAGRLGTAGERWHEVAVEAAAKGRCQLSSQAEVAQAVRAVWCDLNLEDGVARDDLVEALAGSAIVKKQNAVVVVADQELCLGAEHPLSIDACDLPIPHQRAVRHRGAGQRDGGERAWAG